MVLLYVIQTCVNWVDPEERLEQYEKEISEIYSGWNSVKRKYFEPPRPLNEDYMLAELTNASYDELIL